MEKEITNTPEENLFELVMESEAHGVYAWSIVDHPANELPTFLFSEDKGAVNAQFNFSSDEQRILRGVLLVPNKKIARKDGSTVMFTKEEIRKVWEDGIKKGNTSKVNFNHDGNLLDGIHTFVYRLSEEKDAFHSMYHPNDLPEGSLVVESFFSNEQAWQSAKAKKNFGISIEGDFVKKPVNMSEEKATESKEAAIDLVFKSDKTAEEKLKALEEILGS